MEEDALVKRGAYNGEQDVDEKDGGGMPAASTDVILPRKTR